MADSVYWYEITAADIDRAIMVSSLIFSEELQKLEVNQGYPMAILPGSLGGGSAIFQAARFSAQGFRGGYLPEHSAS